jgi:hypothetical protein
MTAIVSKTSPRPHHGDEELRAGAAWRGWCYLSTAYDIQLGFKKMMRCAYSHVIAKVAGRGDPGVEATMFGTFSAHLAAVMGVECDDVTRDIFL